MLFIILVLFILYLGYSRPETRREVEISRVIDGDTVETVHGERIRVKGIDATEYYEECSEEATEKLKEWIDGEEIEIEAKGEDIYDRTLGYMFSDSNNLNVKLVEEGLAYSEYHEPDIKYIDEFIEAERAAIRENRGCLWEREAFESRSVDACATEGYVGNITLVEGTIEEVSYGDGITYLNFGDRYPDNCFTVVIWDSYSDRFSDDVENYEGEEVIVEGLVTYYEGPQIEVRDEKQLHIKNDF